MAALTLILLRWVAYVLFIVSLVLAALTIYQLFKSRRAKYYISRRNALQRAGRWALLALIAGVVATISLIVSRELPLIVQKPAPTPIPTLTATATTAPSPSPQPTHTPTATPTRRPTATPPSIPTPTPEVLPPESALSPLPSAVPAGEDARIEVTSLAIRKDEGEDSLEPINELPPGDYRMYLSFQYEGMEDGIATTFAWYKGEELIDFCSDTWLWGLVEGRDWGNQGETVYYCKPPGGWEPGNYEVHIFIENRLQGIAQFVVTEETE